MKIIIRIILVSLFALTGCSVDKVNKDKVNLGRDKTAPNSIQYNAAVLMIHSDKFSAEANTPCSEYPCFAVVRIDSIIGKGHSFRGNIHADDTVDVYFKFTTGPVDSTIFPYMTKKFPGVGVGTRFFSESIYRSIDDKNYLIVDEYQIIN